jgi:hypothetical protein
MTLVAAGPAHAAPRWLIPTLPFDSVPARPADASAVMAPDGTLVLARFAPGGELEVRERPPGGPVGPTTTIPPVTVDPQRFPNLQLVAGPDGTVALLFDAGAARYASLRAPGAGWTRPEVLGLASGSSTAPAAIAPDGVLWRVSRRPDRDDALTVVRLSAGGRVAASPLPVPPNGARDLSPVLTAPRAGTAHVAYVERGDIADCSSTTSVLAVDVPAQGDAGPTTTLGTERALGAATPDGCEFETGAFILAPLLVTDAAGADTVVYSVVELESLDLAALARHREPGGAWPALGSPAEVVSTDDAIADKLLGGAGAPLLVVRDATGKSISTRGPDGAWTPLAPLVGPEEAGSYNAARTGTGTTVFAWVSAVAPTRLVGRVADASGTLGAPTPLSPAIGGTTLLAVGGDAEGNAAVLSTRPQGDAFVLRLHGYDAAGPRPTALTVPESGVANTDLAFAVSGLDVWSGPVPSASWDFGDGEGATGLAVRHAYATGGGRTVQARIADASGNVTTVSRALTITGPPQEPAIAPAPPRTMPSPDGGAALGGDAAAASDRRAPIVRKLSLAPGHPRAGRPLALVVNSDEPGQLEFAVRKVARGVRRAGRCVVGAHSRGPHCTRTLIAHDGSLPLTSSTQRVRLPRLTAGTWTVTATVTDAAGNRSRARHLNVRVR